MMRRTKHLTADEKMWMTREAVTMRKAAFTLDEIAAELDISTTTLRNLLATAKHLGLLTMTARAPAATPEGE
jgi:DNA-binding transcriptional regulator LsrR (DeoR family)